MVSPVLLDPDLMALWQRLHDVARSGIRSVRHWQPRDGFPVGARPPAHQHTTPTVVMGLSGVIRVRGSADVDLLPGDLLLIEPGCWHDHAVHKPGSSSFCVGFLAARCEVMFFDHIRTLWGAAPEEAYRRLLDRMMVATQEAQQLPLVDELLAQVCSDTIDFANRIQPGVLQMSAYLWNHLHEQLEAEEIILQAGMGRTAAYDRFKEFFGRTPKQELLAQRLALAKHLLLRGFNVTETARRTGFPTRAELTRAYRRQFGHPPTDSGEQ
jgi:AraC-like DNA-binding protein